jgi:hypothetical protein
VVCSPPSLYGVSPLAEKGTNPYGLLGLSAVWPRTLPDFAFSLFRERGDKPMNQESESVLLREFVQQWRQFGSAACSVTIFSAWYVLHHFWAILKWKLARRSGQTSS